MKAGTTWLYDYLSNHPECSFTEVKEFHYFNVLFNKHDRAHLKRRIDSLSRLIATININIDDDFGRKVDRLIFFSKLLSMYKPNNDHSVYVDLLLNNYSGHKVIGDISPTYAALNSSNFLEIDSIFPNSRYVFIMRDPVDRLWSAIRMQAKDEKFEGELFEKRCIDLVDNVKNNSLALSRSNYRGTIQELEHVISPDKILYLFYEDLFNQTTANELCHFLGIAEHKGNFEDRINFGRSYNIPPSEFDKLRELLSMQYHFIKTKFDKSVPPSWYV